MTVQPQGNVYLCKTPLENDYKNQLTFANATAQLTYFNSTIQKTYSNYTYIRKDNKIVVGDNIDAIINCNYLFYRNNGFTNKYYFCFITDMKYLNENATEITFETDCFQTWYFDIIYKQCFVEREHVNDDSVGAHTVPEGLETGEYVVNSLNYYDELDDLRYVIQVTEFGSGDNPPLATNYGGVYMAGGAYVCDDINTVVNILQAYAQAGKSDAVYNMYMIPASFITESQTSQQYPGQSAPIEDTFSFQKPTTIDNYTPINKKLLTYPFNYLLMSNNNGSSNILHYERFSTNPFILFKIKGVPTVGGSIKCSPRFYDRINDNEEEGLIAGKFPTLNWSDDEYTNWLTQNSVNIGLGVASGVLSIVGNLGSAVEVAQYNKTSEDKEKIPGISGSISGIMQIASTLASVYQHSLQPNSAKGNVNGGDINVCSNSNGFFFYQISIKEEYARIIDNFFSMYGYKVCRVKTPNITGRTNWNYVKTIDANMEGDIPQSDLNIIKAMFNNGVTLWHNASNMYNYSATNSIVT